MLILRSDKLNTSTYIGKFSIHRQYKFIASTKTVFQNEIRQVYIQGTVSRQYSISCLMKRSRASKMSK